MFLDIEAIRQRIRAGIDLLDEVGPENWRERIRPNELNIQLLDNCILGQVFGDFFQGCEDLDLNAWTATDYGFNVENAEWYATTQIWLEELEK